MPEPDEPKKETLRVTLPPQTSATAPARDHDTVQIDLPALSESEGNAPKAPVDPMARPTAPPSPARSPQPAGPSQSAAPVRRIVPPPPSAQSPSVMPPASGRIVPPPPAAATASAPPPLPAKTPLPRPPAPVAAPPPPAPAAVARPKKETSRIDLVPQRPKKETSRIDLTPERPKSMSKTQPLVTVTGTPIVSPPAPVKVAPGSSTSIISSIPIGLCWALVAISAAILLIEIWTYIS